MVRRIGIVTAVVIALGGGVTLTISALRDSQVERLQHLDLTELRDLKSSNPDDFHVRFALGSRLMSARQFGPSEEEFRKAVELDPRSAKAHLARSLSLEALGRVDQAETEVREALRLDDLAAPAHVAAARLLRISGRVGEAVEHARRATQIEPRDASAWHECALCMGESGNTAAAAQSAERAVDLDPSNAAYRSTLAVLYAGRHQMAEAFTQFERSLQIDPENAETCAKAGAFLSSDPPDPSAMRRAEGLLLRAIRHGVSRPSEAWFSLGQHYLRTGRPRRAVDAFSHAISSGIQDERFYYGLANAYERIGDRAKTAVARQRFVHLSNRHTRMEQLLSRLARDPEDAASRLELARIYSAYGLDSMARRQYALYLERRPDDSAAVLEMKAVSVRAAAAAASRLDLAP